MSRIEGFVIVLAVLFCVTETGGQTTLDSYGIIGGVVRDLNSAPLNRVEVTAYEAGTTNPIEGAQDSTNSEGQYTILIPLNGQERDTVDVRAVKQDGRDLYIPADSTDRDVGFLEVVILDFELNREAQPIAGRITDMEFSAGIESVYVWAEVQGDIIETYSNEYGDYYMRLYWPGSYLMQFEHQDFENTVAWVVIGTNWDLPLYLPISMEQVIWNVSLDGSDISGRGTYLNPFATIKHALNYASTDDTVLVWPGTYTGPNNTEINITNLQLTIKSSQGPESTSIVCTGYPTQERGFSFTNVGPSTVVDGFTIRSGYNSLGGAIACFQNGSPTLANLVLTDNRAFQYGGALSIDDDSHPVIVNSLFTENEAAHGGAISIRSESSATIDSSIVRNNMAATGNGGGIYIRDSYALMRNCTVVKNSVGLDGDGGGVYVRDSILPSLEISRSIFWYNDPDDIYALNADPMVEYCDVQDSVEDNMSLHPLFCDPDADDFYLGVNSPCNNYPLPDEYIGALGVGCDSIGVIYGVVTHCGPDTAISGVDVEASWNETFLKMTSTDLSGYYELSIDSVSQDTADLVFSHSAFQDMTVDSIVFVPGYSTVRDVCLLAGGCDYVQGDCNHNGSPLELSDITTMIGTYRGTLPPQFECSCPPNGEQFQAAADPNGNCVANELSDVTTEIAAYRGTEEVSGCEDCPGVPGILSADENWPGLPPALKARLVDKAKGLSE